MEHSTSTVPAACSHGAQRRCRTRCRIREAREDLSRLWDDYVRHSTVHGIVYVGGVNCTVRERLVWAAALVMLIVGGYVVCEQTVFGDEVYRTTTVITDNHLPVDMFAFPALSLCPLNKVLRTVAERLLLEHLGVPPEQSNATLRAQMVAFTRALSFLEMNQMSNMKPSLSRMSHGLLERLEGLNITDFMLRVLPTCRQLFRRCTWHDMVVDCCDYLHLQQSDLGYCYSFNSLSAFRSKHCKTISSHANVVRTSSSSMSISNSAGAECKLRRTNSYGIGSALQVYLGELNDSDIVKYRYQRGLVVSVHQNIDLPSPTAGFVLPAQKAKQLELSIGIENTVADREVMQLPLHMRRCLTPREGTSRITATYSSLTCTLECKLGYIWRMCGCMPYMFATDEFPYCTATHLLCLTGLDVLKSVLPPFSYPDDGVERRGINCSHCIPTCEVVSYQFQTKARVDRSDPYVTAAGSVSVYIDISARAKLYMTKLNNNLVSRLTSMGSIAGLVMGVSIVSAVEAVYYLLKTALVLAGPFLDLDHLRRFNLVRGTAAAAQRLAKRLVKGERRWLRGWLRGWRGGHGAPAASPAPWPRPRHP